MNVSFFICGYNHRLAILFILLIWGVFPFYVVMANELADNNNLELPTDSIAKSVEIDEIVVIGQTPLVENKSDRKIIRVSGSYLGNTTDGDEMLRLTPGLINMNGSMTVPGSKHTAYYLNGKKVLNYEEIFSIDPKNVKKIEIIHNPPAMYEADGDAVVKIITKQDNESALRIGATYKQSRYAGTTAFADGTLRKGIFTMSGRYSYNYNKNWTDESNQSAMSPSDSLLTMKHYVGENQRHNARLVFDWLFKKKHNLNLDINGYYQAGHGEAKRDAFFTSETENDFTTYFKTPRKNYEINATINYKYDIDSLGQMLNVLAEVSTTNRDNYRNYYNAPLNTELENPVWTYDHNIAFPLYISGQIDYVKPIRDIWRIEAGIKYYSIGTYTKTDVSGDITIAQTYLTQENNLAEYFTLSLKPLKALSLSAGLRCETMWRKSMSDEIIYTDTVNVDFFPSFSMLYEFSEKYNLGISYSRRIERPRFYMLDPSLTIDPLLNKHGNPDLRNTINNKITLSATMFKDLSVSAFAMYKKDPIAFYIYNDPDNPKVTDIRYLHTPNYWCFGGDASYNSRFFKIWDFSVYAGIYSNNFEYEEDGVKKNNNIPGAYVGFNNQIALPWELKFAVNISVNYAGSNDAIVSSPLYYSYISLKRSFLNESLDVSISLNNIFYSATYTQTSVLSGHNINKTRIDDIYGKISLTYKIGKSYNYRSRSKSNEEKNRM